MRIAYLRMGVPTRSHLGAYYRAVVTTTEREWGCRIMIASDERAGEQERQCNVGIRERTVNEENKQVSMPVPSRVTMPFHVPVCMCHILTPTSPSNPPLQFKGVPPSGRGACSVINLFCLTDVGPGPPKRFANAVWRGVPGPPQATCGSPPPLHMLVSRSVARAVRPLLQERVGEQTSEEIRQGAHDL